jgi:hypothetical protein
MYCNEEDRPGHIDEYGHNWRINGTGDKQGYGSAGSTGPVAFPRFWPARGLPAANHMAVRTSTPRT